MTRTRLAVAITVADDRYLKRYAAWLAEAGLRAVRVRAVAELARYPLLVLGGGGDMVAGSGAYESAPDPALVRAAEPERDTLELALLARARERRLPVLGICRGLEVLNVFLGGTLWSDLAEGGYTVATHTGVTGDDDHLPHDVLHDGVRLTVMSHHHQGLRRLGDGLVVTARSDDGAVEAARHATMPWRGVQWHPERTPPGAGRALPHAWLRELLALGETIDEAVANLKEATELYLEEFSLESDGAPLVTTFNIREGRPLAPAIRGTRYRPTGGGRAIA